MVLNLPTTPGSVNPTYKHAFISTPVPHTGHNASLHLAFGTLCMLRCSLYIMTTYYNKSSSTWTNFEVWLVVRTHRQAWAVHCSADRPGLYDYAFLKWAGGGLSSCSKSRPGYYLVNGNASRVSQKVKNDTVLRLQVTLAEGYLVWGYWPFCFLKG